MTQSAATPNRLIHETSPYLLQHAHNPVDWYPWGPEALARAQAEDKPIFISIGYSACHWCHVLAHESFEDPAIAALMNEWFINIKVDREERPDLDAIYMGAVVSLTGQGGWPLSVFLMPDGTPFWGGTYFPPEPRHGLASFEQVLRGIHSAWHTRRDQVLKGGQELLTHIREADGLGLPDRAEPLDGANLQAAARALWTQFDWRHPGWGSAPKFPQPMAIEFLLRQHRLTGEALPLDMAVKALRAMRRGGMYDHLGGGFHRYSTDAQWLTPHFEKMLYDNAQLARVYLHAYQLTGEADFRQVTEEILDYLQREMTDPAGGFYSSQDADSEGEEGKFFVWSEAEIDTLLGPQAALFKEAYGVQPGGNFEGQSILFQAVELADLAVRHGQSESDLRAELRAARQTLWRAREQRVKPGLDDKVLTAWNGLMLAAVAEAASALGRPADLAAARANGDFLLRAMRRPDGRLFRTWRQGQARLEAFLEDYANAAEGLLALYQATFEARYFEAARELLDHVQAHFAAEDGGFFDTRADHEALVSRPRDIQDNATPCGNAMAATVLLRLAAFTGEARYRVPAEAMLRSIQPVLDRHPVAFAQWLGALAFALGEAREVALVGDPSAPDMRALLNVVFRPYRPFQVVALARPGEDAGPPLLRGRVQIDGRATAAVCYKFTCRLPVTDAQALADELEARK